MGTTQAAEGFLASSGSRDQARMDEFYSPDAMVDAPLTGPLRGRDEAWGYVSDLHRAFQELRAVLHDEFSSPDGGRSCIRVHLGWRSSGSLRGHAPAGRPGNMPERETTARWDNRDA